jgi:uncharacterized damage-inducible protein DinB
MRRTIATATAVTLLACGVSAHRPAAAQTAKPMDDGGMHHAAAAGMTGGTEALRRSVAYQIGEAQKKLQKLAEAMPAEKYAWRPGTGVRSVGEVFMHVASANYFFPTLWGASPPAGIDPRSFEKDGGDKAKVLATLKPSFDYVNQAIAALPDADLHKAIQVFGHPATPLDIVLTVATHAHEHLGQSIAYARTNGVVPPWSEEPPPAKKGSR